MTTAGSALHAAIALAGRCTRAFGVARGVLVRTENDQYVKVWDTAGIAWSREHRAALGLNGGGAFAQALAACRLCSETLRLLDDVLDDEARGITARAIAVVPR